MGLAWLGYWGRVVWEVEGRYEGNKVFWGIERCIYQTKVMIIDKARSRGVMCSSFQVFFFSEKSFSRIQTGATNSSWKLYRNP